MDLTIVDAEVLDSGNIWFKLNQSVTVAFCDDIHQDVDGSDTETSQEWIIMFGRDTMAVETVIHPAEGKELVLTDDDGLRTITYIGELSPTKAFILFTFSIVGASGHRNI